MDPILDHFQINASFKLSRNPYTVLSFSYIQLIFYHFIVDPGYFEEYTSLEPSDDVEGEDDQYHKDKLNILYNATDEPIYDNFQNNTAL